jgi:hypothetical protein
MPCLFVCGVLVALSAGPVYLTAQTLFDARDTYINKPQDVTITVNILPVVSSII